MIDEGRKHMIAALRRILRPLMRFCLHVSLQIQDVFESVKVAMVKAASDEMKSRGEEPNISRLAAMTGMHRRDVMRLFRDEQSIDDPQGLVARVIGQWLKDKRFCNAGGRPRVLTYDGQDSEFRQLVSTVSKDLNPGTLVLELARLGAVVQRHGRVKLLTRTYSPRGDVKEGVRLLSEDMRDLACCVTENIFEPPNPLHQHAKTEYDNIDPADLPQIRRLLLQEGETFHARMRTVLSRFDRDINPERSSNKRRARIVIGSFSYVDESGEKK